MSLSFVSSAVQVGTADGGFEETPIESKETEAVNRRNAHKPLFEQLRANREEDQEKKDEIQRELMRSTCALDEDDVAHLDSIERQRTDREKRIKERTENELKEFRAARALKQQAALLSGDNDGEGSDGDNDVSIEEYAVSRVSINTTRVMRQGEILSTIPPSVPVIKVKKRKRRVDSSDEKSKDQAKLKTQVSKRKMEDPVPEEKDYPDKASNDIGSQPKEQLNKPPTGVGLGGLLSGYGSSSDEDD